MAFRAVQSPLARITWRLGLMKDAHSIGREDEPLPRVWPGGIGNASPRRKASVGAAASRTEFVRVTIESLWYQ